MSKNGSGHGLNTGHRSRMREKLLRGGANLMSDYELIEILLFTSIGRRDVRELAKRLLIHCGGTITGVFWAEPEHLMQIDGVGRVSVAAILCVRAIVERSLLENIRSKSVLNNWKDVINYLRMTTRLSTTEHLRVLYLNKKNHIIEDYATSHGTVDRIAIYSREIIKRALYVGAVSIIISHNHTSGDPRPSQSDILATKKLLESCYAMDIRLVDHIIVANDDHFSFQENNLL